MVNVDLDFCAIKGCVAQIRHRRQDAWMEVKLLVHV